MVRVALETPDAAVDVYQLAFHAGVAMETIAELAATPLFYHRCGAVRHLLSSVLSPAWKPIHGGAGLFAAHRGT